MQERAEACKGVHGACSDVQRHVKACIERAVACRGMQWHARSVQRHAEACMEHAVACRGVQWRVVNQQLGKFFSFRCIASQSLTLILLLGMGMVI